MSIKKEQEKSDTTPQKDELRTEWPLSEKDEQSQAIEKTADLQKEATKKKRKRIRNHDEPDNGSMSDI